MWVSGLESNLDCVLTIIYMILVRVNGGSRVCSRNSGCVAGIHLNEWFSCPQTEVIIQLSNLLSVLSSNNVYIRYPDQWIAREWILYWLKSSKNVLLLKPNQWLSKWLLFFFFTLTILKSRTMKSIWRQKVTYYTKTCHFYISRIYSKLFSIHLLKSYEMLINVL